VITPAINEAVGNASTTDGPAGYERQRADRLMERAHLMLQHNFREEALRLAAVAEQLEKSKQAVYHPGEERPSELVARLQQPSASADVTDAASIADSLRTESIQKRAYRNRSIPVEPKAGAPRGGRIELTDIHAGWQSAAESNEPDSTAIEPAVAGKAAPLAGENQVAHLETPAGDAGRAISRAATAPAPSDLAVAEAPAPAVLSTDRKGTSETAIAAATADASNQGLADSEPIVDTDTAVAPVSRWNATTIGGLIAGLAGLLGLGFWRRQERKHYAAASR
jgi:hypothetical protein